MARDVTVVDAGLGNLASVERALFHVGASVHVTSDPEEVARARMVVFPGQGAFGERTRALIDGAMGAAIRLVVERGDPFLGICLGMQLLFDGSDEAGGEEGLHILPGRCRLFPSDMVDRSPMAASPVIAPESEGETGSPPTDADATVSADETPRRRLKVPHMGWNEVEPTGDHYYFVHSYYAAEVRSEDVMWVTTYGDIRFPAAVRRGNVLGCQFHPEKSQRPGLRFLRAFVLGGRA